MTYLCLAVSPDSTEKGDIEYSMNLCQAESRALDPPVVGISLVIHLDEKNLLTFRSKSEDSSSILLYDIPPECKTNQLESNESSISHHLLN